MVFERALGNREGFRCGDHRDIPLDRLAFCSIILDS